MRLALDTNGIYTTQAGVSRYIRGLRQGLQTFHPADLELIEFAWPVTNFEYRQPQRAAKTFYRELVWAKWLAPHALARQRVDLLHSTSGVLVTPPKGIKHVATLHDLAVLREPQRFRPWQRHSNLQCLKRVSLADRIICDSRFTAEEATALLGFPMKRMEVIYLGCDFSTDTPCSVERKPDFDLPSEFFLFVGSLEPGKNLFLLKAAYDLAEQRGQVLPPLLIVGARWAGRPHEGSPPKHWLYLGRLPDESLQFLYRRALMLLFPSIYEGFGLPPLEAMTLGCPVVCSRVASLPEVGGTAVIYADLQPTAYLEAMNRLLHEPHLRQDLIAAGYRQAQKFSWKKCAEETLAIYRQVFPK